METLLIAVAFIGLFVLALYSERIEAAYCG